MDQELRTSSMQAVALMAASLQRGIVRKRAHRHGRMKQRPVERRPRLFSDSDFFLAACCVFCPSLWLSQGATSSRRRATIPSSSCPASAASTDSGGTKPTSMSVSLTRARRSPTQAECEFVGRWTEAGSRSGARSHRTEGRWLMRGEQAQCHAD